MLYEQKAKTQVVNEVKASPVNFSGLEHTLKRSARESEWKARQSYDAAYKINYANSIGSLMNDPNLSANPQALSEEINKLRNSVIPESAYDDQRAEFTADFDLRATTYINKATANFNAIQDEKYRSSLFDKVVSNDDLMANAFSNSVNGQINGDDVVNYLRAKQENEQLINAKNSDGTYVFPDATRRSLSTQSATNSFNALKDSVEFMSDENRSKFLNAIKDNNFVVGQVERDGKIRDVKLQDITTPSMYADIKRFADSKDRQIRSARLQEARLQGQESMLDYTLKPTQEGLDRLLKLNPTISENSADAYRNMLKVPTNYDAETQKQTKKRMVDGLKVLSNMPADTEKAKDDMLENLANYSNELRRENEKGKISSGDMENMLQDAMRLYTDKDFAAKVAKMPSEGVFSKISSFVLNTVSPITSMKAPKEVSKAVKEVDIANEIDDIGTKTTSLMLQAINDGADANEVDRIYKKGVEAAIRKKYYNIPEMQGELIPNQSVIDIYGKPYMFMGFGAEDVFVEKK